jgi:outer membrane murein-binding lipoprotein Lpp
MSKTTTPTIDTPRHSFILYSFDFIAGHDINRCMEDKIKTVDDLAALIIKTMAGKEDIQELRTEMNQKFDSVETRLDHLDARVGRIEADVQALRDEMVHRQEFQDALERIKYIEKKLGIESGI